MRILAVTTLRNEAPFVVEWVAHMRAIGVTDLLVYTNDCDDGTDQLLAVLARHGVLHHIVQKMPQGISPQWQALKAAWRHPLRKLCDWAVVCDVDEFINVHLGAGSLHDLISAVPEQTDAIAMPWRLFGNAGIDRFEDRPVTLQFQHSIPSETIFPIAATFFKTLFKPAGPFNGFGVHRPKQKDAEKHPQPYWSVYDLPQNITLLGQMPNRMSLIGMADGTRLVECNHYSLRSAQSFLMKQMCGLPNRSSKPIDLAYWVQRNFNTEHNPSIERSAEARIAEMDRLLQLEDVAQAHQAGVVHHQTRIAQILAHPESYELYCNILLAAEGRALLDNQARELFQIYQHLQPVE
ncbi:glycosyltransferase family 2 protein [uncultured Planktomarina sp.]|jgi:hypothetical protein|uniref:glycosyltransferase family 2 protein n=2 Tax=uncultured Planktomarina sp. TaxID=1538529 RepID=UPI0032608191